MKFITSFKSISEFSTQRLYAVKISADDLDKFLIPHTNQEINATPVATVSLDSIDPYVLAIRLVAVLPSYQGHKIGSNMLNAVFEYAK